MRRALVFLVCVPLSGCLGPGSDHTDQVDLACQMDTFLLEYTFTNNAGVPNAFDVIPFNEHNMPQQRLSHGGVIAPGGMGTVKETYQQCAGGVLAHSIVIEVFKDGQTKVASMPDQEPIDKLAVTHVKIAWDGSTLLIN